MKSTPALPEIPFQRAAISPREKAYVAEALESGKLAGDGPFTRRCHQFFRERFGFSNPLLTTSCTDALEMAGLLADLRPGDEVIVPSYAFTSTANAFALRGARIVFADSRADHPNLDCAALEERLSPRVKIVVALHYGGWGCDMETLRRLSGAHGFLVVEDAAQAIGASYRGRPLGSWGDLAAFSFHESKNISSGEGGLLTVNRPELAGRAEILREKGTNRAAFFRGEIEKYHCVDIGSSFLPSDVLAALLLAQLERLEEIQAARLAVWNHYAAALSGLEKKEVALPVIPEGAAHNGHVYYLVCRSAEEQTAFLAHMRGKGIHAYFHYQPLHQSPAYAVSHDGRALPHAVRFGACLCRLPLFPGMTEEELARVTDAVLEFYR